MASDYGDWIPLEDLLREIRAIPPSSPQVLNRFTERLTAAGSINGWEVDKDVVRAVVNNWDACDDGKKAFLKKFDLDTPVRKLRGILSWEGEGGNSTDKNVLCASLKVDVNGEIKMTYVLGGVQVWHSTISRG